MRYFFLLLPLLVFLALSSLTGCTDMFTPAEVSESCLEAKISAGVTRKFCKMTVIGTDISACLVSPSNDNAASISCEFFDALKKRKTYEPETTR